MSADSDGSTGQPASGRPVDWEPADWAADLPASEEPDWYADEAPGPGGLDPGPGGPAPGPGPPNTPVPDWLRGLTFATLETSDCTHPRQSRGYQPSPSLRHLIQVRNPTCTGPRCRRPATRCDLDHVTPYDQGGKTCECNLHLAW
jgi:hypothetical protein